MGGERASTTRRRCAGLICYTCGRALERLPNARMRERQCEGCAPRPHRVLMNAMFRNGWHIHFIAADGRTRVGGWYQLRSKEQVLDLAKRGACESLDEFSASLETWGRASVHLKLTEEQYRKLRG